MVTRPASALPSRRQAEKDHCASAQGLRCLLRPAGRLGRPVAVSRLALARALGAELGGLPAHAIGTYSSCRERSVCARSRGGVLPWGLALRAPSWKFAPPRMAGH